MLIWVLHKRKFSVKELRRDVTGTSHPGSSARIAPLPLKAKCRGRSKAPSRCGEVSLPSFDRANEWRALGFPGMTFDARCCRGYTFHHLVSRQRLSSNAGHALDGASAAGDPIYVPTICLIELTYLVEKRRLPSVARARLINALDDPSASCKLTPLIQLELFQAVFYN
jgi:hypothetical protein